MTISTSTRLLSPTETGQLLGRSVAALAALRHRGGGPRYVKNGRIVRYRLEDLERWLESGEREHT